MLLNLSSDQVANIKRNTPHPAIHSMAKDWIEMRSRIIEYEERFAALRALCSRPLGGILEDADDDAPGAEKEKK